jgi:membrane protease YdiL (CAAX protease family)
MSAMKAKIQTVLKSWAVISVSTFLLCFLTQHGAKILFNIDLPEQGGLEEFRKMIGLNWRFALNVALAVLILPPVEELLFRFLAFRLIARKTGGEWRSQWFCLATAFASSVVFTAVHYLQRDFPDAAFIALTFFGCAQCWLYRRTGSIVYPMINHALFNLTTLVFLVSGVA